MSNEEYTFEDVKMGFHQKKEKKLGLFEYFEKLLNFVYFFVYSGLNLKFYFLLFILQINFPIYNIICYFLF